MEKTYYEAVRDLMLAVFGDGSTVKTTYPYRTLLDHDIVALEQKLQELDELYARRRAELRERIERLEALRERASAAREA